MLGADADPASARVFAPYVPRTLMRRLAGDRLAAVETIDGTLMFADISGFTRLSERLARLGRVGAEHLVEAIGSCFQELLVVAYANGGSLLKFAGDALLLLFDGEDHAARACRAATGMRQTLREVGQIEAGGARAVLRMSVGVHSDAFHLFVVGDSHRELIIAGPPATTTVELEHEAGAGQILLSRATAALLPARCVGEPCRGGVLLRRSPLDRDIAPAEWRWEPAAAQLASCVPTALRAHVRGGLQPPEHRTVTVAFVRYTGVDALIAREGPQAAAAALHELIADVQCAADELEVALLGSDLEADGGKLMLTAGAPRSVGDDEERMLLAMRRVVEGRRRLPVRVGVNRGAVFTGDVGPGHRRTYTTMGDATNLAARLMARAPDGELLATAGVLGRSATSFELTELPPFTVKGKKRPVTAWSVGPAQRSERAAQVELPLVGRAPEVAAIEAAVARARAGEGRLLEVSGEMGVGKTRLAVEARARADGMRVLGGICDAYGAATPYALWRDLLRQSVSLGWDDPDEVVLGRIRSEIAACEPGLLPWLPLLATVFDVRTPSTEEVDALAAEFRQIRTHEVVLRFLARQLAVPTLVEIEQAHLMDEASAALLGALTESLAGSAWLVLVTSRATGAGFTAPPLPQVEVLALRPLSAQDTRRLAEAATEARPVPPYVVSAAVERAGGNPQFLLDLLALGAASGQLPDSAEAAAMARIDALEPNDRALVRRLAVLGMGFAERDVSVVLDPGAAPPDAACWRRLAALVGSDTDGQYRFARANLREAAYAALPFRTRRGLHAAVAEHSEQRLARTGEGDRAALSWHHKEAGQPDRALPHALAAAELAASRSAHADAARLYRRAIDAARACGEPPATLVGVWESLGEALRRTGEMAAAHQAFTAARGLVEDPVREAELLYLHSMVAQRTGRITAAVRWVGRALRAVEGLETAEAVGLQARLWSALAGVRARQGRYELAEETAERAIAFAEQAGEDRALAHACWLHDVLLTRLGRPVDGSRSQRAIEIYKRLGDTENLAKVLSNLGVIEAAAGRWDRAMELYAEGAEHSARAGDVISAAYGDCNIGEMLSDQGRYEEAEPRLRRALQVWDGSGDEQGTGYARLLLGRLAVRRGEPDRGRTRLEGALADLVRLRCEFEEAFGRMLLAEATVAAGEPEEALRIVAALSGQDADQSPIAPRIRGLALAGRGEPERAREAFAESLARARADGSDFDAAAALDGLAALAAAGGEPGAAAAWAAERDDLLARLGVRRMPGPRLTLEPATSGPGRAPQ